MKKLALLIALLPIMVFSQNCSQAIDAESAVTLSSLGPVSGVVTLGTVVENADVTIRCASGSDLIFKTSTDGKFIADITANQLPCMAEVRNGTFFGATNQLVLHALINKLGLVNISYLSELALAHAYQATPISKFGTFRSLPPLPATALDAGDAYVTQQLNAVGLGGLSLSETLNGLTDKLSVSQRSFSNLITASLNRTIWTATLAPAANTWQWVLPVALPGPPIVPANNPMSNAKVELGRHLFYETKLSNNKTFSCASCHLQSRGFADDKPLGLGSTGEFHPRGSLGLGNVAYNPTLTWANPNKQTLEEQMLSPLFGDHPIELANDKKNPGVALQRLSSDVTYSGLFAQAFPNQDNVISWPNVIKAIAAFERTMLTGNSRYDQSLNGGPPMTAAEVKGANLFFQKARCFRCHGNFNFNDTTAYLGGPTPDLRFHNTGLFNIGGTGAFPVLNRGIFEFTKAPTDMGKFRAPSLRDIAETAPYMHDGSIKTLEEVVDFYTNGGRNIATGPNAGDGRLNPFKDSLVNGIVLTAQEKADLIAFLKTLTDSSFLTNPKLSNPF